ncbi:SWIM zinc finger domain-containing protein [Leptolyngbya cf. ectocarpi LEGE 11479]|uniref:SWIM zinc finger domain-containing protein n=1 Tax=Leptolyngbya cf. ectocarpi LEGE 11479 TaxID=1828722 RepID=A0A928ZVI2_LEPEC|nr:SWIM zinc finger family protein [Leptolyngbya ectocarpi]MBE9068245.1 SWIM zinc finger domain-containing protein [Leptolyngbya cf. ectocarpi LEGE 11479]
MTLPKLTLSTIKRYATDKSFSRGQSYWKSGAVISLTQRQTTLQSEVEGNDPEPYRVTVDFDSGGITSAHCSCPYSFEGWCKHIVAVLIACVEAPDTIEQRPTLAQLLDAMNLVQTQGLVQELVDEIPALIETVDLYASRIAQPTPNKTGRVPRKTSVDPAPFQRRVREILRDAVHGWDEGWDDDNIAVDLNSLAMDALAFAEKGDGHNALAVMEAITTGCISRWDDIYDYLGMGPDEFDIDLDAAWTESILSTDLTEDECLEWQEKLEEWQDSLGSFAMALEALRQGWDYPPLVKVLQGETAARGGWSGEAPNWAEEFSLIRLKILQRQERYEEYLYLAQAEGHMKEYLAMLGQLGRTEEAVEESAAVMTTCSEAQALAEVLRSQQKLPQALDIAIRGLRFESAPTYNRYDFAVWTSELAEGLEEFDLALEARMIAFQARPSLQEYQTVESLAADWPEIKAELLDYLRTTENWMTRDAKVDVFLQEGLVEDAIASVDTPSYGYTQANLVLRVMDAAIESHASWVIKVAKRKAEEIINAGKAKDYDLAVKWLQRTQRAYIAQNKQSTWQDYSDKIVSVHGRKRKLIGLMKAARL